MTVSTLVKTIAISNSSLGEFKFEIYQDENGLFYTDISNKNTTGEWVLGPSNYRFSRASNVDEAVEGCIKFLENKEIDMKTAKIIR